MIRIRRLLGLPKPEPDDRVFSDEDIEAARATKMFLDAGFDEERIVEITRVLGEGMARLAATITASFVETFLKPGDSEDEVALRFAGLAEQLTPAMAPILVAGFKAHLRDSVAARDARARAARGRRRRRLAGPGRLLRRPGRLHPPRRPGRGARAGHGGRAAGPAGRRR